MFEMTVLLEYFVWKCIGGISETTVWQLNIVDPQLFEPQFSQKYQISEVYTSTYRANMCATTG